jgi:squalene-hopene/tetraprenyl-beta-curcumene cyclase
MTGEPDTSAASRTLTAAQACLLAARNEAGTWSGELSSSALSTAVAAFALYQMDPDTHRQTITRALCWLADRANPDGGWGDTPDSPSNLSTTLLGWSALGIPRTGIPELEQAAKQAEAWINIKAGTLDPEGLARAVIASYGNDRTFSAPILTLCALSGRLGHDPWPWVPQLPFEWIVLPRSWFRFARLEVVSYALPALIAIGLVRHRLAPRTRCPLGWLREAVTGRALRLLRRCQPPHGGFLEAAPLNGFVAASLASAGLRHHPVARDCARFLTSTVRPDGSWPIDTNLATWLTTLSINALSATPDGLACLSSEDRAKLITGLTKQQFQRIHPFTHAAPGGWGWTDLPGAVPDADDTAGVLLALHHLDATSPEAQAAAGKGIPWLLGVQNNDGGIPTFCRGWGRLPFDRSCPDLTAHALLAFDAWSACMAPGLQRRIDEAIHAGVQYLARVQKVDGSWLPLWFGNQHTDGQTNPTYGTAHVVRALTTLTPGRLPERGVLVGRGTDWLLATQNRDGGWGGNQGTPSTIEETSLAMSALSPAEHPEAVRRGAAWLGHHTNGGTRFDAAPIGLYFAQLWYSEQLYPVIFSVQALASAIPRPHPTGRS